MSLRLILVRHAKSDWGSPGLDDHDRPLNGRGERAAPAMGAWLRDRGFVPARALVSSAVRARQTWAGLTQALDPVPDSEEVPALYLAAPETILEEIGRAGSASPLLVIGHNPGFSELGPWLADAEIDHDQARKFPTCAALVMDFDASDWTGVRPGTGRPIAFQVPRSLSA